MWTSTEPTLPVTLNDESGIVTIIRKVSNCNRNACDKLGQFWSGARVNINYDFPHGDVLMCTARPWFDMHLQTCRTWVRQVFPPLPVMVENDVTLSSLLIFRRLHSIQVNSADRISTFTAVSWYQKGHNRRIGWIQLFPAVLKSENLDHKHWRF